MSNANILCGVTVAEPGAAHLLAAGYHACRGEIEAAWRAIGAAMEAQHPQAPKAYAILLYQAGDFSRAREVVESGLLTDPENLSLMDIAGFLQMLTGDFAPGFENFARVVRATHVPPDLPEWKGEPLQGRSIFISRTRCGFGDEILWARFAPELARRGASVYVECAPALTGLFQTLEGVTVGSNPGADCFAYMEAIPAILGTAGETIPRPPYLRAGTYEGPLDAGRFNVGISWGKGPVGPQSCRFCLTQLAPISRLPGVRLHSFEKSDDAAQLYPPPAGMEIVDLGRTFHDFCDTAAAIAAMDLIISADNVIANLAGALAKLVFVLAPFNPEFRWGVDGKSPWYPAAQVFQQPSPGSWGEVIEGVAELVRMMADCKLSELARVESALTVCE